MEINELVKIVQPYSMATEERLRWIAGAAKDVIERGIPGDFIECGVCNGGSAAILAHYAIPAGRKVHLFDSFAGLPAITANDVPSVSGHPAGEEVGKCVGSMGKVAEVLHAVGALSDKVSPIFFYRGWFKDTFKQEGQKMGERTFFAPKIDRIAMLNLDSDWFESEKLCWETWWDKVVPGGYVYIDDFFYWPGCQKAAKEFFHNRDESVVFHQIGHSAWVQKGERPFDGNGVWIQGEKSFILETK